MHQYMRCNDLYICCAFVYICIYICMYACIYADMHACLCTNACIAATAAVDPHASHVGQQQQQRPPTNNRSLTREMSFALAGRCRHFVRAADAGPEMFVKPSVSRVSESDTFKTYSIPNQKSASAPATALKALKAIMVTLIVHALRVPSDFSTWFI